ncbi:MAG TPA: hypothetical protein PLJ71_12335 [Candidatus Hydrogenedentes bacterium]|nr:hypothetical protein [Candidatus Hydrogenedentota bacterium]HQM49466.1 hypothetical protein [Candidatus Hydrogenedentota bacterium]
MRKIYVMLFTALALGLAWAIRGHFGHEWGASWAGGVGGLALLVAMRDPRYMRRTPVLAALCAIGWGAGGIMSYGIVIGYCRGNDFINVIYGFSMLVVIGGLYGFLGGGLFGLGLESTEEHKPKWGSLTAEMVAGAWIAWGLLIYQFEWYMTPPRSELWAACFGASSALAWYLYREGYGRALRVGAYSALGGGLGFALGNFLQVIGSSCEIPYNWWNVMEFTLGFCGGLGMAYAVVSRKWPDPVAPSIPANRLALLFLFIAIPFVNHIKAVRVDTLSSLGKSLEVADVSRFVITQQVLAWVLAGLLAAGELLSWRRYGERKKTLTAAVVPGMFLGYLGLYTIFSYITGGLFYRHIDFGVSHTMYVPILAVLVAMWFAVGQKERHDTVMERPESGIRWLVIAACVALVLVGITFASINMHAKPLGGSHKRFFAEAPQKP